MVNRKNRTLLVVIEDALSALISKGEITDRYYNPGDLFDDVHILMINNDRPGLSFVQKMVGRARPYIHNIAPPSCKHTLGWQSSLMQSWLRSVLELTRQIQPSLVRAYGNYLNGFLAAYIKRHLGIPLVVSLHTNPDESERARVRGWTLSSFKRRLMLKCRKRLERTTLSAADRVVAVCESYREYALRYGAHVVHVIPNVVNPTHLHRKTSYDLHSPARVCSVGRQTAGKNPVNLIRAVAELPVTLTLIGDGELHEYLRQVTKDCGVMGKVTFLRSVSNDELCEMLPDFDVFAVHSDYCGIPKSVIEALLVGLPVVVNRERPSTSELEGDWIYRVENTLQGYRQALLDLMEHYQERIALGNRGYKYAREHFDPRKVEKQLVDLCRELIPDL